MFCPKGTTLTRPYRHNSLADKRVARAGSESRPKLADAGALKAKPQPGAPRGLTDQDFRRLEELLLQGATAHGWLNHKESTASGGETPKGSTVPGVCFRQCSLGS
jgi:hypothetical protein